MPAIRAGRSRAFSMQIQQDHVAQHICFAAAPAAFAADSKGIRVPGQVQQPGFVRVVE